MQADLHQQIAQRAYELFLARGGEHGHAMEDWLAAEAEFAPHDVVLADDGPNTIEIVRALRELTGLALPKIRSMLAELPTTIRRVPSRAEAEPIRLVLEPLGARLHLVRRSDTEQ
jgi:large subunit ribosomal protein L7/L12